MYIMKTDIASLDKALKILDRIDPNEEYNLKKNDECIREVASVLDIKLMSQEEFDMMMNDPNSVFKL